jgi:hypothetical protein
MIFVIIQVVGKVMLSMEAHYVDVAGGCVVAMTPIDWRTSAGWIFLI